MKQIQHADLNPIQANLDLYREIDCNQGDTDVTIRAVYIYRSNTDLSKKKKKTNTDLSD